MGLDLLLRCLSGVAVRAEGSASRGSPAGLYSFSLPSSIFVLDIFERAPSAGFGAFMG